MASFKVHLNERFKADTRFPVRRRIPLNWSDLRRQDPGDLAARYGGEEFAVILPNTALEGAITVAHRILTALSALALRHPNSPISAHVTLSIGAASASRGEASAIIGAADAALYQAKQEGRNRVIAAAQEQESCRRSSRRSQKAARRLCAV